MRQTELLHTIRENLRFLRNIHNMTQEEVANRIHMSRSAYAAYETGSMLPNVLILKKIADLHNLKIDDLLSKNLSVKIAAESSAP